MTKVMGQAQGSSSAACQLVALYFPHLICAVGSINHARPTALLRAGDPAHLVSPISHEDGEKEIQDLIIKDRMDTEKNAG
jgi:hypothetical protein